MQEKVKLGLRWLLLLSIVLSMTLVVVGALLYLVQQGLSPISDPPFPKTQSAYTTLQPILHGSRLGHPFALIFLGFLVLVYSQILRVLVLGLYFLLGREYWLALASFFILSVLMYSMLWH